MVASNPQTIHRLDYQKPQWSIPKTRLWFDLKPQSTRVISELQLKFEGGQDEQLQDIILQGVDCHLISIAVDGEKLDDNRWEVSPTELCLKSIPRQCVLRIETEINPDSNKALEGLYLSSGIFCTQCEAEGFRKITYYLDRPDVLSIYEVEILGDATLCPVMLCNGNLIEQETLENGRHRIVWHDPYPKPCYLFALVAGDLYSIDDKFTTRSGRKVALSIYVQEHNLAYCDFAMESLKAAMAWDESSYGFEYDLDRFMIVAVDDFNMGAMENKGLNIFNSRYVLADDQTATDEDFLGIESVVAHEYFHNWTGNRITCRDWFQLSLKEGLTVYRDQCFTSDQRSATVKRIEDVRLLRARQFPEDAGPMAHPIRPESYIEINNFYTLTVYEKGAEVVRMLATLLGPEQWRAGMDLYVERHDGAATTCDAFVEAMQAVTDIDLTQFKRWYSIAGTPEIQVTDGFDKDKSQYWIKFSQFTPDTPGQSNKPPLHIPIVMGLIDKAGNSLELSNGRSVEGGVVLDLTDVEQTFYFDQIDDKPVASLLRGFSAPVRLYHEVSDATLAFQLANDTDGFNRWDAGQRLAERVIFDYLETHDLSETKMALLSESLGMLLLDKHLDDSFKAEALKLPTIDTLAGSMAAVDFHRLCAAHEAIYQRIASDHYEQFVTFITSPRDTHQGGIHQVAVGQRRLATTSLGVLSYLNEDAWLTLAGQQYREAENMTIRLAALSAICHTDSPLRTECLAHFYQMANGSRLVIDKWFSVQAAARRASVLQDVVGLTQHEDFDASNPNRLRSLVGSFAMHNPRGFHQSDGKGYRWVADHVISLDRTNPQVAARLVSPLGQWRRLESHQQNLMKSELQRIMDVDQLSPDVYELVSKSLA